MTGYCQHIYGSLPSGFDITFNEAMEAEVDGYIVFAEDGIWRIEEELNLPADGPVLRRLASR